MKIALISTASINETSIIRPIKLLKNSSVEVIFSRDISTAEVYAKEHQINKFGTYTELEKFKEYFDTAYISLPNAFHFSFASKLLKMGKNVICEKPLCFSLCEALKLDILSKKNDTQIFEAYHFKHHPSAQNQANEIAKYLEEDDAEINVFIGNTFPKNTDIRLIKNLGGGAFSHLGCYITEFITKYAPSASIRCKIDKIRFYGSVDTHIEGDIIFNKSKRVNFVCSLNHTHLESYIETNNNKKFNNVFTPSSRDTYTTNDELSSYFFQLQKLEYLIDKHKYSSNINFSGIDLFEKIHKKIYCIT